MDWLLILVAAAVAAVVSRLFVSMRKQRRADQADNWDKKAIERIRAQGKDPFRPYEVDFFFAAPNEGAVAQLRQRLEADGFAVDARPMTSDPQYPFSVHARKSMRLSAPDMTALSANLGALAKQNDSRYDGWAAI
jgi:hypothetical protein